MDDNDCYHRRVIIGDRVFSTGSPVEKKNVSTTTFRLNRSRKGLARELKKIASSREDVNVKKNPTFAFFLSLDFLLPLSVF